MKKLLLLLLVLGVRLGYAQSSLVTSPATLVSGQLETSVYTQLIDSLTAPLNKSRIPGGILYDRVVPIAMLHDFTQATPSSATHLQQSYYELRGASYNGYGFPYDRDEYGRQSELAAKEDETGMSYLPIGILDYKFAVLDTLAEEKGTILTYNGLYADGAVGTPYQTRNITIASFLKDSTKQSTTFKLPANLLVGNTNRTVKSVVVTVDGKSITLLPGGTSQFFFSTVGVRPVQFKIAFTDNSTVTAAAEIKVLQTIVRRPTNDVVEAPMDKIIGQAWTDYFGTSTFGEGQAVRYLYNPLSANDWKLRRPIIIIDGFDPADKRPAKKVHEAFAAMGNGLRSMGQTRDLVVLNFPVSTRFIQPQRKNVEIDGGADYIERNALVLVELLNKMKAVMADPNEKITIVGPSMGGLISRYALALMEKNYADASNLATYKNAYWKHNVDTWISFDAPHLGANIPVGDQAFVNYFAGSSKGAKSSLARLNSIAARQMLVHQWLNLYTTVSLHEPFMRALQANGLPGSYGFPTQVRRVGIANGDITGAMNLVMGQPGQVALQLDVARKKGNKRRQFFYRSTTPGTQIAADIYYTGPSNVYSTVFNGEARAIVAAFKDIKKRWKVDFRTPVNYDLGAGGTYAAQQEVMTASLENPVKGYDFRFFNVRPDHNFIPMTSALAFNYRTLPSYYTSIDQLPNPYTNLKQRNLICDGETPFDSYYAYDKINTEHVTFNDQAAQQFLLRELVGQTQAPRFKVASAAVTSVCPNSTIALALDDCARTGSVTYNWNITGPAVFTSSGTGTALNGGLGQSIRVTGLTGTITVSVTATRAGAAPSPATTQQFTILTEAPLQPVVVFAPGQVQICPYSTVNIQAKGTSKGPYYWTSRTYNLNGSVSTSYFTTRTPNTSFLLRYNTVKLSVTGPGSCSGVMLPEGEITVSANLEGLVDNCDPYSYGVYPNPTNQYLMVTTVSDKESPSERTKLLSGPIEDNPHAYKVTLYNDRGKPVQTSQTKTGELKLDTSTLPNGLYHVQMQRGQQIINRNISIQH